MTSRVAQLAVLAAATAVLAPASALARADLGPKTDVGVFGEVAELDVGAREAASLDEHLENFDDEWALAAEKSFHENRYRLFDPGTGDYNAREPIMALPHSHIVYAYAGHSMTPYGYALGNPVGYFDPTGLDTVINIWRGWSTHSSVYIDRGSSGPTLFDPAGSAFQEWIVSDPDVLSDYASHWSNAGDPIQEQYRFKTTAAQEQAIENAFLAQNPSSPQPFTCAMTSVNALDGIGPFKFSIIPTFTPGGLGDELEFLQRPPPTPKPHPHLPARWQ